MRVVCLIFLIAQVADMKAEYIPPREDVIMQNESPDEVYIIVSGEVEMIDSEMENEKIVWTLRSEDVFGEVGAFCCRPQSYTYRTRTLSQLLKIRTSSLIDGMKSRQEDNVTMMKNFLQVPSRLLSDLPKVSIQSSILIFTYTVIITASQEAQGSKTYRLVP